MRRLLVIMSIVFVFLPDMYAQTTKSKVQIEREKAWKKKMATLKAAKGEVEYFKFLGLELGGTKARARAVIGADTQRVTQSEPPVKRGDDEIHKFKGNHRLGKVKLTMLEFFRDRLLRITLRLGTDDLDITYTALLEKLEEKYGKFAGGNRPGFGRVRETTIEEKNVIAIMTGRGEGGSPEVVIIVSDKELLKKRREAQIEKEKNAIGDF